LKQDIACTQFIDWAVKEVDQRGLKVRDDYRISLFTWMKSLVKSVAGQSSLQSGSWTKEDIVQELMKLGLEGELVARMGPHLTSVLVGEADPLAMLLEDDFLYRVYNGDAMTRGNRYLAEYTKHFAFQRSGIRILEIGAGTGGATFQLLQLCSPDGEVFTSEYCFTDISSGYFDAVRTSSLKKWAHMLTFKKLDLEKDPTAQGFEEHGYDLILASNVVHATVSLTKSLGHIHRLLKPGGVLGLMEIVKTAPLHNMTFGLLPGWWAGKSGTTFLLQLSF
jgi:SAM-dependent methyltransferase